MNESVYHIPLSNLALTLLLVAFVGFLYARWTRDLKTIAYATLRMLLQLTMIGFALIYIFDQNNVAIIILVLAVMLTLASWITLRPIKSDRGKLYPKVIFALSVGCLLTLVLVIQGVLRLDPWFSPRYLIPIAGMIFANTMNTMSLALERFQAEIRTGSSYRKARGIAYQTGLIPLVNSFFAVGIVALPGMMTGQILSGVSPLIAVRYQMLVMCMLLGSSGISTAVLLALLKHDHEA